MMKPYFIMLNCSNGGITPLVTGDLDDELATYDTEDEAVAAGKDNTLGNHFGFEVFCTGCGEISC